MAEEGKQQLVLRDREILEIKGVEGVESFESSQILLETNMGGLLVSGDDLHIASLDLDNQEAIVKGYVNTIEYKKSKSERSAKTKGKNFLSRVLK